MSDEKPTQPPFDGKPCPMCPVEVRNLAAVAHNLISQLDRGASLCTVQATLSSLRGAVKMVEPYSRAHFADPAHCYGPGARLRPAAADPEREAGDAPASPPEDGWITLPGTRMRVFPRPAGDPASQAAESIGRLKIEATGGAPDYLTAALSRLREAVAAADSGVRVVARSFEGIEAEVRRRVSLRLAAGLIDLAAGLLEPESAPDEQGTVRE